MNRLIPLLIALVVIAAACGDDDAADTTGANDTSSAFITSVEFQYLESYPVQVRAVVTGDLPTPCHELQWSLDEADPNAPVLEVWSTVDPDVTCAQVLEPFEETIPVGSFETGEYTLTVNGETHAFQV